MTQHFQYDEENRVTEVRLEGNREFSRAKYRYDLLGRRTQKRLYRHGSAEPEIITFHWSGLQLAGEESSLTPAQNTQYVYSEGSWEPLARVDSSAAGSEVYWYHTALNGLPARMTDAQGNTVWKGEFSTWGETQQEQGSATLAVPQNLRFQGQYLDRDKSAGSRFEQRFSAGPGGASLMDEASIPACTTICFGITIRQQAATPSRTRQGWRVKESAFIGDSL